MSQVPQQRFGCYIGNIDRSVTLEVLRQVFSQCGVIIDCSLNGRDEDPYRYGFIDFASEDDRARAMKYNGFTLAGRKIKVGVSKGNVGRPEGFNNTSSGNNNNTHSGGNTNTNNNNQQPQQMQQPQQPQIPPVSLAASFLPTVMHQQQQSAQLLMQLIQQGAIDVNNLTPEQQQILMASLLPQAAPPAPGIPAIPPMAPMGYPPMHQAWGAPRAGAGGGAAGIGGVGVGVVGGGGGGGMYAGGAPINRGIPYSRGPANPMPSEETVKLREVQRKQFLDVVRRDAEKYEKKLQERSVKEGRVGSVSGSDDSSEDEDAEKSRRTQDKRNEDEKEGERNTRTTNRDDSSRHNHHQNNNNDKNNNSDEHTTEAEKNNDTDNNSNNDNNDDNKADDKKEPECEEGTEEHKGLEEVREAESQEGKDDREEI
ncbi:putative RNA-binding protein 29 [Trypanosoma cruzi]|uniref:Peptidyl-prolyl cis-trans isomerase n=1 Tax=Trypanosoma cruzi TaxID=5693 RepID=A0A7J6YHA4_TRYCR|nr:hypothetical protein ECC02_001182 [Trypanosoma cruzi]KAF8292799.1 putative RNA-binding protein 29 [Trypanosoma cruzi]